MDISPNYSATIFGLANAIAASTGLINSLLMDHLIEGTVSICSEYFEVGTNGHQLIISKRILRASIGNCCIYNFTGKCRTMESHVLGPCRMFVIRIMLLWIFCRLWSWAMEFFKKISKLRNFGTEANQYSDL